MHQRFRFDRQIGSINISQANKIINLDVFPESRGVVIPRRFGIPKRFHDGIRSQYLFLGLAHPSRSRSNLSSFRLLWILDGCKISHYVLGADSFSSSGFTAYHDRLI